MTKYHISYVSYLLRLTIYDDIIDIHPLIWRSKNLDDVLIAWSEIPEEIENQVEEIEKERIRLIKERTTRQLEDLKERLKRPRR